MAQRPQERDLQGQIDVLSRALQRSEERAVAGQLALELMHEIKNPLEAMGHLIYLAHEGADDTEKTRKYLRMAKEQMTILAGIIGQTLGMTRPSHLPRVVDLGALVASALRIHQRRIEERHIHIIKNLKRNSTGAMHPGEILQVITNLVANALDAMEDGGTLRLWVRRRPYCLIFILADEGHGIPAEKLEHIFEPFFTTKQEHGSGLGLTLSKRIIEERHHGQLTVRSSTEPDRSGTIFRMTLPIIKTEGQMMERSAEIARRTE